MENEAEIRSLVYAMSLALRDIVEFIRESRNPNCTESNLDACWRRLELYTGHAPILFPETS